MPKHGWKWRTEQFRQLDPIERQMWLYASGTHISAKFCRWAYEKLELNDEAKLAALRGIGQDLQAPWAVDYLLNVFKKNRAEEPALWAMRGLNTRWDWTPGLDKKLEAIFRDETVFPAARASAFTALYWLLHFKPDGTHELMKKQTSALIKEALNSEISELRALGGILANIRHLYEERVEELRSDASMTFYGMSVAECIRRRATTLIL